MTKREVGRERNVDGREGKYGRKSKFPFIFESLFHTFRIIIWKPKRLYSSMHYEIQGQMVGLPVNSSSGVTLFEFPASGPNSSFLIMQTLRGKR